MAASRNIARYRARLDKNSAKALEKKLAKEFESLAIESERDLTQLARTAERTMRALAPKETGHRSPASKKYGPLARSIELRQGKDDRSFYVDVSVGPFYSSFQEYGTVHQRPRPFFRPAIALAVAEFQSKTNKR